MRITQVVVAMTLVSDARSKMVSGVIGSEFAAVVKWPKAFR